VRGQEYKQSYSYDIGMEEIDLSTLNLSESAVHWTPVNNPDNYSAPQMDAEDIIGILEKFLSTTSLPKLNGICALTVAHDRQSLCGTFIFDYSNKKMLKHYPARYPRNSAKYMTIGEIRWTINLCTNLPEITTTSKGVLTNVEEDTACFPFCCDQCDTMYKRRLTNDSVFQNFKDKKGSLEYTFKVVKKIQFGDLLWIKYFKLKDDELIPIDSIETSFKVNSFKIYSCERHNTYYSVDLHTDKNVYNYHHAKGQNETEYGPLIIESIKKNTV
jgi:hypothetical protein